MTLADRLVVLNGGRIEQIGTPMEVYRNPASTFVAAFIGSPAMNLIPATKHGDTLHIDDARLLLPAGLRAAPDGAVTLGIRPEDLRPAGASGAATLPLAVAYVEDLGAQRLVHGRVGGHLVVCTVPAGTDVPDLLQLEVSSEAMNLFDGTSGTRISAPADGRETITIP